MGVVVTLKSKMATSSAWSYLEILDQFYLTNLKSQTIRPSRYSTAEPHQNTCLHYCYLNFPLSGKYNAILDSFVTITPTMHVRATNALFDVIMHKVYSNIKPCYCGNFFSLFGERRDVTSARFKPVKNS